MKSEFPNYIEKVFIPYTFKTKNVKIFTEEKRRYFKVQIISTFIEFSKMMINMIFNSNKLRLYIVDFVCTWSSFQALFNFAMSFSLFLHIRLHCYLLFRKSCSNGLENLSFLRVKDVKELIKKHNFTKHQASYYLKFVNFLIKFMEFNRPLYALGTLLGLSRVLVASYTTIDLKWFILVTLPSAIHFQLHFFFLFKIVISYYLVFGFCCLFFTCKLKSLNYQYSYILAKNLDVKKFNIVISKNLLHLNQIIKSFGFSQRHFNLTVFTYESGLFAICFSFPYILIFQTDDLISKLFGTTLFIQCSFISLWIVIRPNKNLNEGVNLSIFNRNFLLKYIIFVSVQDLQKLSF